MQQGAVGKILIYRLLFHLIIDYCSKRRHDFSSVHTDTNLPTATRYEMKYLPLQPKKKSNLLGLILIYREWTCIFRYRTRLGFFLDRTFKNKSFYHRSLGTTKRNPVKKVSKKILSLSF